MQQLDNSTNPLSEQLSPPALKKPKRFFCWLAMVIGCFFLYDAIFSYIRFTTLNIIGGEVVTPILFAIIGISLVKIGTRFWERWKLPFGFTSIIFSIAFAGIASGTHNAPNIPQTTTLAYWLAAILWFSAGVAFLVYQRHDDNKPIHENRQEVTSDQTPTV